MAYGDIGAAEIDFEEFDPADNYNSTCVKRANGILIVFNTGTGSDGFCRTYPVDTAGNIGTKIAELEFEPVAYAPWLQCVAEVATGIYLLAYRGDGNVLTIKTISVSADGITIAVIDTLVTAVSTTVAVHSLARKGTTNTYVAVWHDSASDGWMTTITCDADGTNIANPDIWEFEPVRAYLPRVAYISGDIFAVSYADTVGDGAISTVEVADDGTITEALIDTQIIDSPGVYLGMLKLDNGDLVEVAYRGPGNDGWLATLTIDNAGTISAPIDTAEFDPSQSGAPVLGDLGTFGGVSYVVVHWQNAIPDDCYIESYSVASDGTLAVIAGLRTWATNGGVAWGGCEVQPDIWAFLETGSPSNDGYIRTFSIETVQAAAPSGGGGATAGELVKHALI